LNTPCMVAASVLKFTVLVPIRFYES
jgi:hypothetical protein